MLTSKRFICTRSIAWCFLVSGVVFAGKVCADQTYDQANPSAVWDTSTLNWDGSTDAWNNSGTSNAIFTGTSKTVDVNAAINVGNITFNSGGWNIGDIAGPAGSLTLGASSTITVTNATDTDTISAPIVGGAIAKAGLGTLVLSGNNTFSGTVLDNSGILKITSSNALGANNTTTVASGATLLLGNGVNVSSGTVGLTGAGGNSGGALQADAGATATWGGTITIDAQGGRVGAGSGGTLNITGVIQNGASNPSGTLAVGEVPGASTPGTVVISGTNNTYSGLTQIVRGVLKLGATNALPATTVVDVSSSNSATEDTVFDLNGFSQNVAGIQRTNTVGAGIITNNGATPSTLTVTDTTGHTYSGVIRDGVSTVALTKAGSANLVLSGANTYSGATSVTAGTLTLSGSLANTAITSSGGTTGGQFAEFSTGVISGTSSITVSSGTFASGLSTFTAGVALNGTNTFTGAVVVNNNGALSVTSNGGLGNTSGITVGSGELILGSGVTVTGKSITVNGTGTNNNGALQSAPGVTATWAGNIVLGSTAGTASRIGGGDNGTLIINGVISGVATNPVLFNRGLNAVTILNSVNTYLGDTQLFANGTPGVGAVLKLGVDNAINAASRLSSITTALSQTASLDLNGHVLTLRGLDTSTLPGGAQFVTVTNNAASTTSTLTVGDATVANTATFGGTLQDGTSGGGGLSLVKINGNTQILTGSNTYTGSTTVSGGTLQVGASGATNTTGTGTLASPSFFLNNGGTFALNNAGTSNNNTNRISDSAVFTMNGGTFLFTGSATANSSETIGSFALNSGVSKITATSGGMLATVTAGQFTRNANAGIALVNGVGLGQDSSSNVGRIILGTAPTLVGTTAALSTGINASAQNTQIVPYLLGEATSTTGGKGTATGTANTFVTYSPTTGLRPLNLTDEFTQNAFTAGNNIHLTSAVSTSGSVSINSLIIDPGGSTSLTETITAGQTLTVTSGAVLFSSGNTETLAGGTLAFGNTEGIITINAAGNTSIGALLSGTAGISYYGSGTLVLQTQQSTYSGSTLLAVGTVIPQTGSTGPAGAPVSGPFGTGTLILGGSAMRATTAGTGITLANAVTLAADTTFISAGLTDQPLVFTGPVTITNGTRTLTQNSNANTSFTGNIGDGGNGYGLTIAGAGTGTGAVVLSGTNTYSGGTSVKDGTLVVSGSISGSTTIGDSANLTRAAVLGGSGTVGNVTVGVATGNTGASLKPHAGSTVTNAGVTLHAGSVTFANSSEHLSLQIGRSSAYNGVNETGAAGGDVSDHLATTGALTLNGADLQLSLLTTAYTPVNGDLFFLTINSGGAINGTFSSLNGTVTNLSEGSIFTLGSQSYEITYLASYNTNSFTGGNDIALEAVIPEPSTWMSLFGGLGCLVGAQRFRRSWGSKAKS